MKVLRYYPYRTGMIRGRFLHSLPRKLMEPIEKELCKQAKVTPDNHTCFLISGEHYETYAIMFSDFECTIGETIEDRKW